MNFKHITGVCSASYTYKQGFGYCVGLLSLVWPCLCGYGLVLHGMATFSLDSSVGS